jgi:hypothetical protein
LVHGVLSKGAGVASAKFLAANSVAQLKKFLTSVLFFIAKVVVVVHVLVAVAQVQQRVLEPAMGHVWHGFLFRLMMGALWWRPVLISGFAMWTKLHRSGYA